MTKELITSTILIAFSFPKPPDVIVPHWSIPIIHPSFPFPRSQTHVVTNPFPFKQDLATPNPKALSPKKGVEAVRTPLEHTRRAGTYTRASETNLETGKECFLWRHWITVARLCVYTVKQSARPDHEMPRDWSCRHRTMVSSRYK